MEATWNRAWCMAMLTWKSKVKVGDIILPLGRLPGSSAADDAKSLLVRSSNKQPSRSQLIQM